MEEQDALVLLTSRLNFDDRLRVTATGIPSDEDLAAALASYRIVPGSRPGPLAERKERAAPARAALAKLLCD
jgi:hypothetical protein